jgi:hypothetical protein
MKIDEAEVRVERSWAHKIDDITREEAALFVATDIYEAACKTNGSDELGRMSVRIALIWAIRDALNRRAAEEREACAKLSADRARQLPDGIAKCDCAAAIRGR